MACGVVARGELQPIQSEHSVFCYHFLQARLITANVYISHSLQACLILRLVNGSVVGAKVAKLDLSFFSVFATAIYTFVVTCQATGINQSISVRSCCQ